MANRYWTMHENMGYQGTDSSEEIDLLDWWGITQEELDDMTNEEVEEQLSQEAWQQATEKVEAWVEVREV